MNSNLIEQVNDQLGANGLPYPLALHPNLVHLTLGLFIAAIAFDMVGVFYPVEKQILKVLSISASRTNFFDVGWYNMLAAAIITFFTVATGFYEIMLAEPPTDVVSAWGLKAMETMLWHGIGGVILLFLIVLMTVWRGLQRFIWRKDRVVQVQWTYLLAGLGIFALMFAHGTLGAHLAADFGVHISADRLLRAGENPNILLK
ncbi:DUF2231 domain-containing protein [Gloeocapsa sp. PCC 73106]|uniref:DUF2231 domain-containing protein n=1 Tax=Gloeocapsa sp. PCC 73106 TaxID=102232 RepID=UPI0002ABA0D6|nr:DUF2231 domain-containing protein [Gloeocapsa sp. PCC 73106]ELR97894.1 putative membrane protein [Gloeocapsa sp. PCC 73106]